VEHLENVGCWLFPVIEGRRKLELEAATGKIRSLGYKATPQWTTVPGPLIAEWCQSLGEVQARCPEVGPS
jgi:hypothetical protein